MGKSNAKKVKPCGYQRPHQGHVHDGKWCQGMPESMHKHDWEHAGYPILVSAGAKAGHGEIGSPWQGPYECKCGKAVWLTDGRLSERFPRVDALERIMALKAKVDGHGPESLSEEDKAELQAIADDIVRILQPLMDQLQRLGEMVAKIIQGFLDSLPPETLATLSELGKSIGEKPDAVETIDLVDSSGEVVDTLLLTPTPASAVNAISLQEDDGWLTGRASEVLSGYDIHGRRAANGYFSSMGGN